MRSLLFVPADSPRKLDKALGSGADCLILDLEDSVSPDAKAEARASARDFIAANRASSPLLYVRVNDLASGLIDADLATVMSGRPHGIMLPKAAGARDVGRLSTKLRVHEAQNGIADGETRILPIITETAVGVFAAPTFDTPLPRLSGITWGAEDLATDIGASANRDAAGAYTDLFRLARSMALLAAAATGTYAVDTIFADFRNETAFHADCLDAMRDGFTGRMAIHPAQVPVINEVFTPSPEALAHARSVVAAFEAAGDPGVVAIDGKMFDRPHLKQAQRLIARSVGRPG